MANILQPAANLLKLSKSVQIYDPAFMIHTKYTVAILIACTCLVSATQYFGDPIECRIGNSESRSFINSMCWTIGAYVMANRSDDDVVAERVNHLNGERIYLRFYQWIAIYLLMQSLIFYLPAYLWKMWEGRRLAMLCDGAETPILEEEKCKKSCNTLLQYFTADYRDVHFLYAAKYTFCEILNFVCSAANMLLMNVFLNGYWSKYVLALRAIPQYEWDTWNRITSEIFPKVAKCGYKRYGPAGGIEQIDALCMLPLNIVNEKVFVFLWPWFVLVGTMATLKLLYRVLLMASKRMRLQLLRMQCRSFAPHKLHDIVGHMSYGDWFMLSKVSKNVNPLLFGKLVEDLHVEYTALHGNV